MKIKQMFLSMAVVFSVYASNHEDDVVVILPPELSNRPGASTTNIYKRSKEDERNLKLRNKIPSAPDGCALYTFGQLTKQSDAIIIGKVKKIIKKPKAEGVYTDTAYEFKVNVVTNLYGHTRKKHLT